MKKPLLSFLLIIVISSQLFSQTNNLCGTPKAIVSSTSCSTTGNNVTGSITASTTYTTIGSACGASRPDVWFSFIAQGTYTTISLGGSATASTRFQVYSAASCGGTAVSYFCSSGLSGVVSGLTAGLTYLIRVYTTTGNSSFNVCVIDPPANDLCANATSLNNASTCNNTGGSLTAGTTYTTNTVTDACNITDNDVWFKFVAHSQKEIVTLATGAPANTQVQVLSNSCGGTYTSFYCGGSPGTVNGLTIGSTYLVRVYSTNNTTGNFNICVTDQPPGNDACAGATVITPNTTCSTIPGSLFLATQTNPTNSCGNMYDVWYQFTMPSTSTYATVTVTPTSSPSSLTTANTFVEVFNANACGTSLNNKSMGCYDISAGRTFGLLNPGGTYYFRVYTNTNPNTNPTNWSYNICVVPGNSINGMGSRMNEVYKQTILSLPGVLNDPWEIAYGPDGFLWITESRGYKIYRMNPSTGAKTMILDISLGSSFFTTVADQAFNLQFDFAGQGNPQGGLAGLAIHPDFNSGKKFVYISYIHKYVTTVAGNAGVIFRNQIVKFTYNSGTNRLESPESLCDTLPGSSDHNSQRMIIAPVGAKSYLFYAQGDMGAGQFGNAYRANHAQDTNHYEGKILRFNLESDGQAGLKGFIPDDNPFNNAAVGINPPTVQSAVWATGIRNNQGFAYAKINGVPYLYGSSHGPFSDDEVNIIEKAKNYGHPRVIGMSNDHNYDAAKAGGAASSLPLIYNEALYASDTIGAAGYRDPIYCFYAPAKGSKTTTNTIQYIYNQVNNNNNDNSAWPSLAPSGMEIYTNSLIPGWKNSLILGSLKGGRVIRLKLKTDGSGVVAPGAAVDKVDTINYFRSINRFRDVAIAPDGKTIFAVIDKSSTTSGPTTGNPIISACAGCVQKYTFLGYNVNTGNGDRSYIPTTIPVASGTIGAFETANKVVINAANDNNNLWVPITDTNSNIVAEINARGQNLDTITTSFYTRTGSSRISVSKKYLNRNLTIKPQHQPGGPVGIRLYISAAEYNAMVADGGVADIAGLKILKNEDSCLTAIGSNTQMVNTTVAEAFGGGYVLQGEISGFSSFYFSGSLITLPLQLLAFKGALQNDAAFLQWETSQEINTSHFIVERSIDGSNFTAIGTITAAGNSSINLNYDYTDYDATKLGANIIYYRLKMVDKDAAFTYSRVINITLPYVAGRVTASPNPFTSEVRVDIAVAASGKAQWKLIDNNGHVVMQGSEHVRMGANQLQINTSALASGTYYLSVSGAGVKQQIKIQKQ